MTNRLPDASLAEFETLAVELSRAAGAAILPLFRTENGLEDKAEPGGVGYKAFDPVTRADRGAEAAIRQVIAERYPNHGVIGEEYGEDRSDAEFVWVLDPIDGTRAFIAGVPLWTTLIALRWHGRPEVGVIGQSYLDEIFIGSRRGSRLIQAGESRALQMRPCPALADAVVGTTDPVAYFTSDELQAFGRVRRSAKLVRYGGDAYFFALAAHGLIDLVIEGRACKAWDVEAAIPLIEGAGGFMTDWRGGEIGSQGGQILIAGDRRTLDAAIEAVADAAV